MREAQLQRPGRRYITVVIVATLELVSNLHSRSRIFAPGGEDAVSFLILNNQPG